ncbi:MAG TPA: energy transducer TonB [Opitutus sp.]|nr:energy transducer TonB [Opitutus sp.]
MKFRRSFPFLGALAALATPALMCAQNGAAPQQHGYTVTVQLHVDEQGNPQKEQIVDSDDPSPDHYLEVLALAMAAKTHLPPHLKNGHAVAFNARAPFFFPIEGDEGPEADNVPKPKLKQASLPVYPAALREAGVVGGAILEIAVDAEGKLTSAKTIRASHPDFNQSALDAVKTWEFAPAQKDGQAVASDVRLAVVFDTQTDKADLKWRIAPRPSIGSFIVVRPSAPVAMSPGPGDVPPALARDPQAAAKATEAGK